MFRPFWYLESLHDKELRLIFLPWDVQHSGRPHLNKTMIGRVIKHAQLCGCCSSNSLYLHANTVERAEHRRQNKPRVCLLRVRRLIWYLVAAAESLLVSNRRRCFCQIIRIGDVTRAREFSKRKYTWLITETICQSGEASSRWYNDFKRLRWYKLTKVRIS